MSLTEKLDSFIRRLRWLAFHFEKKSPKSSGKTGEYGFKSTRTPPSSKYLLAFENDLFDLIKSIKFRKTDNRFLQQVKSDVASITRSKNIYVFADKTTNLYEVDADSYDKVLHENITKVY